MLQTLFYIPFEIAGWPVFGFGLLLAVWAVAGFSLIVWLVRRQGFNADTWGYVPILLVIGAIIAWVLPALSSERGLPIRGYGVMMLLAVVSGTALAAWRARRVGIDADTIFSLAFWMLVPGIIGARTFYVIEYWPEYARAFNEPGGGLAAFLGSVVNVAQGGLVVYGSFFGGLVGFLLFVRKHRLPLLATCDLLVPSFMLGLALGRIGCLLNGCCFGGECNLPWAVTFPPNAPAYEAQVKRGRMYGMTLSEDPRSAPRVLAVDPGSPADRAGLKAGALLENINGSRLSSTGEAYRALENAFYERNPLHVRVENGPELEVPAVEPPPRSLPVHPTQLYSSISAFLLCFLLLALSPLRRRDGELLAVLLTVYPIVRFVMEIIRTDESPVFGTGMSISQVVSLLVLLSAAGMWFYLLRQPRGTAFKPAGK